MLFTGKSDNQRQGITPARAYVSWKTPLFHSEEGKVQKFGNSWHGHRNLNVEMEDLPNVWAKIFPQPEAHENKKIRDISSHLLLSGNQ